MKTPVTADPLKSGRDRLVRKLARYGLAASLVDEILSRHTLVRYPRGATIFNRGAATDMIFLIVGGVAKICCESDANHRVVIGLAGQGDLIGIADKHDARGVRSQLFEAEAMAAMTVALVTREHLGRVLRQLEVPILLELLEALNSMWAESLAKWAQMLGRSLRHRLEYVLGDLAERFGVRESRGLLLPLELGQQELGEMIGGSRPMVGKLLQDLERDGVIVRQGRHFIVAGNDGLRAPAETRLLSSGVLQSTAPSRDARVS